MNEDVKYFFWQIPHNGASKLFVTNQENCNQIAFFPYSVQIVIVLLNPSFWGKMMRLPRTYKENCAKIKRIK